MTKCTHQSPFIAGNWNCQVIRFTWDIKVPSVNKGLIKETNFLIIIFCSLINPARVQLGRFEIDNFGTQWITVLLFYFNIWFYVSHSFVPKSSAVNSSEKRTLILSFVNFISGRQRTALLMPSRISFKFWSAKNQNPTWPTYTRLKSQLMWERNLKNVTRRNQVKNR